MSLPRSAAVQRRSCPLLYLSLLLLGVLLVAGRAARAVNEVQKITVTNVTGAIEVSDGQGTASLAQNATAAQVQTALAGLPTIGAGNVSVSGSTAPNGGVDQTGSGTSSASSSTSATQGPTNAFDNNASTDWIAVAGAGPHWIAYDFGAGNAKTIVEYSVTRGNSFYSAPAAWNLQGSNDNTAWTTLDTRTAQNPSTRTVYTSSNTTAYRYYRLWITAQTSSMPGQLAISEIELIGSSTSSGGQYTIEWIAARADTDIAQLSSPTSGVTISTQVEGASALIPLVPTGLTATAGNGQVALQWNASSLASQYRVKWATTSGGPYTTITVPDTTYTHGGLTNGTTYYYVVSAANDSGQSANSPQVSAMPHPPPPAVTLNAPTTGGGMPGMPSNGVSLSWSQSAVADFASYKLYRGTAPGVTSANGTLVTTITNKTSTSASDTSATSAPAPGVIYYYVVYVFDTSGQSTISNEQSITLINAPPAAVTLNTPTTGGMYGGSAVSLSWSQSSDSDFVSYKVYRGTAAGVNAANGTLIATNTNRSSTSASDASATSSIAPGTTYFYAIFVTDSAGQTSWSNEKSITLTNAPPAAVTLNTPTTGGGMPGMPSNGVSLSWSQSYDSDFASYKVYRGTSAGVNAANGTLITTITNSSSLSASDTTATSSIAPGTTYFYAICVTDAAGRISWSNEKSITLINAPPAAFTLNAPSAGGGMPGAPGTGNSLYLSWSQSSDTDFASYKLYRGMAPNVTPDNGTLIATVTNASSLSASDPNAPRTAPPGTTYYYVVYAADAVGQSTRSNEQSILRLNGVPNAVTLNNITTSAGFMGGAPAVNLSWTQSTEDDFARYKIYRSTAQGVSAANGTLVVTLTSATTTSYSDTGATSSVAPGTTYYYVVVVEDSLGQSATSGEKSITLINAPPAAFTLNAPSAGGGMPGAPGTGNSLSLSWTQTSDSDFASYKVYRGTVAGVTSTNGTLIATNTNITSLSASDPNAPRTAPPGTTYYYVVYASDAAGQSTPSNEQSILRLNGVPNAVTLNDITTTTGYMGGAPAVSLSWTQSTEDDFSAYKIYRLTMPGVTAANGTLVATLTQSNTTSYTDTGVAPGTTYYYVVVVVDSLGQSATSNEKSITVVNPPPAAPLLSATAGDAQVLLTWNAVPDAASYTLKRSTTIGGPYTTTTSNITETTYTNTAVVNGTTYYYVVVAVNSNGASPHSNEASATPNPPDAPGPPTFSNLDMESVTVHANFPLPARALSLTLQGALVVNGVVGSYAVVATGVPGNSSRPVFGLDTGATYSFRWVAVGRVNSTPGPAASITMPTPVTTWLAAQGISCGGIRWPQNGMTVQAGARGRLSAFLATDWDQKQVTINGTTTTTTLYSDPCQYVWGADGGTVEGGDNTGQSIVWIAPTTPGTYTIDLVVDDQAGLNKPPAEGGNRNDAAQGYNDDPIKYEITITVVP